MISRPDVETAQRIIIRRSDVSKDLHHIMVSWLGGDPVNE